MLNLRTFWTSWGCWENTAETLFLWMYWVLVKLLRSSFTRLFLIISTGVENQCRYQYSTLYHGYCYFGNTQKLAWEEARCYCRKQNGYLANIQSAGEGSAVSDVFPSSFNISWIGLTKNNEGSWVWDMYNSSLAVKHTNWLSRQPDNYLTENCTEIILKEDIYENATVGSWNNKHCKRKLVSVCKKGRTYLNVETCFIQTERQANTQTNGKMEKGIHHHTNILLHGLSLVQASESTT